MAKAAKKIVFSRSCDIPFDKLVLSEANIRRVRPDANVEELADDIARREDLIQGLNVRPILDEEGNETGMFEIPAGGRRYRAIERLVKAKRFPKNGLVPCIVRDPKTKILAEDDSLAENSQRVGIHPLDQYRAFKDMHDKGMSQEEIAAAYFTTAEFVKQRLRLAAASPVLLEAYAGDGLTLAMLEAFTVNPDHARQEQVWQTVQNSHNQQPWQIRRMLTETTIPALDKRARFIGLEAYVAAGGPVLRDLFETDNGGYLQDVALLDRLVSEKLKTIADEVAGEGWKWIKVDLNLPYGYDHDLRRLTGVSMELTDEEHSTREQLREERDRLEAEYEAADELPEQVDQRLSEIEEELDAFENRPVTYTPDEIVRAGVFITVARDGDLVVTRGYVRPEDEVPADPEPLDGETGSDAAGEAVAADANVDASVQRTVITMAGETHDAEEDEGDATKPLPDRLLMELTAHRTLALQDAVANNPHVALTALLHRLVLDSFRHGPGSGNCLEAQVRRIHLSAQAADLKDSMSARSIRERQEAWQADLPEDDQPLWDWLSALDDASRLALLAHCVSFGITALHEKPNPYGGNGISQSGLDRRLSQADRLARAVGLDMVDVGWTPTVENYLGRVTKSRIIEAVREGAGERSADLIGHLKKGDMAKEAERLLTDKGWLPEPLRLIGEDPPAAITPVSDQSEGMSEALPEFLSGDVEHMEAAE